MTLSTGMAGLSVQMSFKGSVSTDIFKSPMLHSSSSKAVAADMVKISPSMPTFAFPFRTCVNHSAMDGVPGMRSFIST